MREFKTRHDRLVAHNAMDGIIDKMTRLEISIKDLEEYAETLKKNDTEMVLGCRHEAANRKRRIDTLKVAREKVLANKRKMASRSKKKKEEVVEEVS